MMNNFLAGIICVSSFLFSCTESKQNAAEIKQEKKVIGKMVTDSVAPPIVTPISPAKPMRVTVTSKPYSLDPRMGKEAISTITPANGLPLGNYIDFVQDNIGNIWFNSRTNIIKYDGLNFTSYPLVPGDNVFCHQIAIDCNNELWASIEMLDSTGSRLSKLFVFNGLSFEPLPVSQSISVQNNLGIRMYTQSDKSIWVFKSEGLKQLLKFKGRQLKQTITQNDFSFKSIADIKTDKLGDIWFADRADSTITRYDGKTFKTLTRADGLPKSYAYSITPFSADSIYLSTTKGIYFFNGHESTKINDNNNELLLDNQSTLWSASSIPGEVAQKISSTGLATFKREDGFNVSEMWDLKIDKEDNVWVMSQNLINRLYKPVTAHGDVFPGSHLQRGVRTFYNDRNGRYWFGSYFYGASCYNGKTLTNYSFTNYDSSSAYRTDNHISSFTQDRAGNIWISTFKGSLIKFDGKSFFINNKTNGFSERMLYEMFADSKGNIWWLRNWRGILLINGVAYFNGKETVSFTTAQGLCSNDVRCIFEDRNGTMWFGTNKGLSRFKDGRFTTFNEDDGLTKNAINAITADEYGNLWLGTEGGVSRFDGERFINYTTEEGLVEGKIQLIQKDMANHKLWLRSDVGFTALTIKSNNPDSVLFENFTEAEGFPLKSTFGSFMVDNDGAILQSEGNNSIKRFDYKKVKENSKPFNLHISQIRLNNEIICWSNLRDRNNDSIVLQMEMQLRFGKLMPSDKMEQMASQFSDVRFDSIIPFDFIPYNLSLPYKANSISFDFAAIDPHFSKSTRYQYMLEGFDKTWSPLSKNTNANFGNLREGSYTFMLKALNPYGKWSELNYSFNVLPPWYRTWWSYALYVMLFVLGIGLFIRWRTKALQNEKTVLEEKVTTRTAELKQSLENLKSTQSQLIQSEKMASLGELTAGIAHEIQNPLNFVNNFSEINLELAAEINDAAEKGDLKEVKALTADIRTNQEKIRDHGKRADAIVKGMLQHSRSSSGQREPTDINALADEYLRLAYHGLRAKDKSFNAIIKTDFDQSIGNINIIPQDIGRVLLNLINNAFYAVDEKKKKIENGYEPEVTVSTKLLRTANSANNQSGIRNPESGIIYSTNSIIISVRDNGNGIPQKLLDKIYQPFFTTKPTGQGTGLGLSLSYDIVKAHGGEIKVTTTENEGTVFTIQLPIS